MDDFEQLVRIHRPEADLIGVIAIHSTRSGAAAGGCRLWRYADDDGRVTDAMRLARGMSYKNALAGLPFGGAKAVLQLPDRDFDRERFFTAFAEEVDRLGGAYLTAEDVGTTVADMAVMRRSTRHVAGLPVRDSAVGGDPSPYTAQGVFRSIEVAVQSRLGRSMRGIRVAVQGVGHVGQPLCQFLAEAGADLVVADVNAKNVAWAERFVGARAVPANEVRAVECDVLAPCARGAVFDWRSVADVRARIICGAANNQLATESDGDRLAARGICYVPDYVANAGGIINVAAEHLAWPAPEVDDRVAAIALRVARILQESRETGVATHRVAERMAERIIQQGRSHAVAA